jgi:hypothetical protein
VSYWFVSRFVVEGERDIGVENWSSMLATLLLGWWGILFGPVFTIRALTRNLAGGDEVTVADLLNPLPQQDAGRCRDVVCSLAGFVGGRGGSRHGAGKCRGLRTRDMLGALPKASGTTIPPAFCTLC